MGAELHGYGNLHSKSVIHGIWGFGCEGGLGWGGVDTDNPHSSWCHIEYGCRFGSDKIIHDFQWYLICLNE